MVRALLFLIFWAWGSLAWARQFYADAHGSGSNPGSFSLPWRVDTALKMPTSRLSGGDTLWLRGGVYKGQYILSARGLVNAPLIIKAFPGEHVVFDSYQGQNDVAVTIEMTGNYVWLVDVEITNSSPTRISMAPNLGSANDLHQSTGINIFGAGCKLINCSVNNVPGTAVGYWSTSLDAELYGCIIYDNGFSALDRGHGPAIYAQNNLAAQPKAIRNSFIFSGFSTGIQFYGGSNKLKGLMVDSSTVFNMGSLTRSNQARRRNILIGAETSGRTNASPDAPRADRIHITDNVFYRDTTDNIDPTLHSFSDFRENTEMGFQDEQLSDIYFQFVSNRMHGDPLPLVMHQWDSGRFRKNFLYSYRSTITGNRDLLRMANGSQPVADWDSNVYHINQPGYNIPFSGLSFQTWQATFGIDANSVFMNGEPDTVIQQVRRNKYQPNKYYITVLNYSASDSVALDWQQEAFAGYRYALFDVQYSLQKPLRSGQVSADTPIFIPTQINLVRQTQGLVPMPPRHTTRALSTFVMLLYKQMHTVKAGDWNDPTVWNTGTVPTEYDEVQLLHPVTLNKMGWCKSLLTNNQTVSVQNGGHLFVAAFWQ